MAEKVYEYDARLVRVVDGDTVYLSVSKAMDFGFHIVTTNSAVLDFRLLGINAPEMHGASKGAGEAAKEAITKLITGKPLRITTAKAGKFGRWLATIYVKNVDGTETNVNQWMVDNGFAVVYNPK